MRLPGWRSFLFVVFFFLLEVFFFFLFLFCWALQRKDMFFFGNSTCEAKWREKNRYFFSRYFYIFNPIFTIYYLFVCFFYHFFWCINFFICFYYYFLSILFKCVKICSPHPKWTHVSVINKYTSVCKVIHLILTKNILLHPRPE